ncbi:MAG: glycosyltransferase family 1 protein [Candidatus Sumerlaeota bacterium]|nr:glycosyltransferase family 1 protein [Candidatus Sumerlaeota bacterium]
MTIAFDARMISYSGIGTQIRGLLRALRKLRHPPEMTLLGDLNEITAFRMQRGFQVERYVAPIYSVWNQYWFPRRWPGARALHVPHYNIPYRYEDPLIVTIHDLIHLLFPWQLGSALKIAYARYTHRQVAKRADMILCDSEFTRRTVLDRLSVPEDRTRLLPNAVDEKFQPAEDLATIRDFRHRMGLPSEYLLAVGIDKPHKNHLFLLRALKPLWQDGKIETPLIIAGCGKGKGGKLHESIARTGTDQWARMLDWIELEDMPLLYQGAALYIQPSTFEGFGLPVLEAQRVGTPVASSDAASLPEVGGEGAIYFDPYDEESCRYAVTRALGDSEFRQRLVTQGHINEQRYSWTASAQILADTYREF